MASHGARLGAALAPIAALAAVLRCYPLGYYPGVELMEHFPRNAVVGVLEGNWRPFGLHHGAGLFDVLRALFTLWYAGGRVAGVYGDRLDFLAAFLRDPQPFVLVGRAVVVACAVASVWLVGTTGTRCFGRAAGVAGALLLAVTFAHVRESHHVWPDVPAGAAALAATAAALAASERAGWRAAVVAGAAGGVALAAKHSAFAVAAPVALGVAIVPGVVWRERARRLVLAAGAAAVVFLALSPYVVLDFAGTVRVLTMLSAILYGGTAQGLSTWQLVRLGQGVGIAALAAAGLVLAAARAPRATLVLAAFPVGYVVVLARQSTLYGHYLAPLMPFTALFAGAAAGAAGERLAPRRPAAGALAVAVVAGAAPLWQSIGYDRFLARPDTRVLAGEWIRAHVPPGTPISLPNAIDYPNPVLPIDAAELRLVYPDHAGDLLARGVGTPATSRPVVFQAFFDRRIPRRGAPPPYVVDATHPIVCREMNMPDAEREALRAAGARAVARFDGHPDPLPPAVVFDPVEGDYVPMTGFDALERPGPNVTIWALPGAPAS